MDHSTESIWYYKSLINHFISVVKSGIGWILLISLALITFVLLSNLEKDLSISPKISHHIPDYTLHHFQSIQMDEQGYLKSRLIAEKMVHYVETKTELTSPLMVFYKEGNPAWTVQAQTGEVSSDGNEIWLLGQTRLEQHKSSQVEKLEIISKDMRLQRDTQYLETASVTKIISPYGETRSVGARMFIPQEQIELLSQVRGHYVLR